MVGADNMTATVVVVVDGSQLNEGDGGGRSTGSEGIGRENEKLNARFPRYAVVSFSSFDTCIQFVFSVATTVVVVDFLSPKKKL